MKSQISAVTSVKWVTSHDDVKVHQTYRCSFEPYITHFSRIWIIGVKRDMTVLLQKASNITQQQDRVQQDHSLFVNTV